MLAGNVILAVSTSFRESCLPDDLHIRCKLSKFCHYLMQSLCYNFLYKIRYTCIISINSEKKMNILSIIEMAAKYAN